MKLLYKEEAYKIIGACLEVYNEHRHGFVEPIYHESLVYELADQKIPAVSQPHLEVRYKGRTLKKHCEPDFVCYGKVILELKATKDITDEHRAQVLNYLKGTGFELGLLVNFGQKSDLQWERIVRSEKRAAPNKPDSPPDIDDLNS